MFNLLPQQDQRNLASDYRLRFVVVALLFFCLLGVIAIAVLVPSFLMSHQKEVFTKNSVAVLKAEAAERSKEHFADTWAFMAKEVNVLGQVGSTTYAHELVAKVIQNKTDAIKITGIHVTRNENGGGDMSVAGEARDRDSLLSFVRILEKEKMFESVMVPPSNFAPAADLNFSILIKSK